MDGDDDLPHDFFSQTASSGVAMHPIDGDRWGMLPPHLPGPASRDSVAGGLNTPRIRLENLDLNTDCAAAASYPNLNMYTHLLHSGSMSNHGMHIQRTRSDVVPQRAGHPLLTLTSVAPGLYPR
jgi:hypothetical protein